MNATGSPSEAPDRASPVLGAPSGPTVTLPRVSPLRGYVGLFAVLLGLLALTLVLFQPNVIPNVYILADFAVGFSFVLFGGASMGFVHGRQPPRPRRRRSATRP